MTEFMKSRAIPVDWFKIARWWRHAHAVVSDVVESLISADTEIRAGGRDQGCGLRQDLSGFGRWDHRPVAVGQTLALVEIKHGEALEERDRAWGAAFFGGLASFVARREAMGIDDGGAAGALADIAAQFERLAEGQEGVA
jgi:hypothetical protein